MRVRFTVPGDPRGWARATPAIIRDRNRKPILDKNGNVQTRVLTPKAQRAYQKLISVCARVKSAHLNAPMSGAVRLRVLAVFEPPQSWSKKKKAMALEGEVMPTSKPDADNIVKNIGDACNAIVFEDDAQIVKLGIEKVYGTRARVMVEITPYRGRRIQGV